MSWTLKCLIWGGCWHWDFPTKNGVSINDESFGCMSSEEASNKET